MCPSTPEVTLPVQKQLEAYNARDIDAFMACWAEECQYYEFPSRLLASGLAAVRARHVTRFMEPNLFGTLHSRAAIANVVVDHETVTRTFPEGPGEVDVLAIYEVEQGKIAKAWFKMGTPRLHRRRVAAMAHTITLPNGYAISDDRARLDMEFAHGALATAYWAIDRPRALTERSWANCLCFGVYAPGGAQVGFARVMTDYTFRAYLGDVFIDQAARGLGLGKALIATILGHPDLATVAHWTLKTADAHGLYAQFGFRLAEADGRHMALEREVAATPAPQ